MSLGDEVKYQTLVETAPDPIFIVDMDSGAIVEVNDSAVDVLGYTKAELVGQQVMMIHPDEHAERYVEKFEESVQQESIQFSKFEDGTQVYLVAKDGERIPVDIHANVVDGVSGPVLLSIARDVTHLKEYEDRIEELADELAVVNRIVRHDIRNDMAVVLAWLEQLESELDAAHHETLELLLRRSEAVVELTDTVKDYVEMLEEDADVALEPVALDDVVEEELTAIEQAYDTVEIATADVPGGPVMANSMLDSVFRNLFHNAVQHNDKDVPEIEVTATEREETIVVHVADNGPGIPDERKSDVFGKGDKGLDSSGTGIGLYLIGQLVEKFGGDIEVTDNEPQGAVFSVELRKA